MKNRQRIGEDLVVKHDLKDFANLTFYNIPGSFDAVNDG